MINDLLSLFLFSTDQDKFKGVFFFFTNYCKRTKNSQNQSRPYHST